MKLIVKVEGMHCNGCKMTLENELKANKLVTSATVNLEEQTALVECVDKTKNKDIEKIVKKAGFKCLEIKEEE